MSCGIFFSGNLTSNEAKGLVEQIEKTLSEGPLVKARPPFQSQHTEQRIVKLGRGADWYYPIAGTNSQDDNSALQTYFQVFIVMLLSILLFDLNFQFGVYCMESKGAVGCQNLILSYI